MQSYTADETFKFTQDMLTANPDMRGLFVQTDQPAIGALRAIKAARRNGEVLVAAFDGIPEFVDLLKSGEIVASGHAAALPDGRALGRGAWSSHLGRQAPEKQILVPILVVTSENIDQDLPTMKETVFANELKCSRRRGPAAAPARLRPTRRMRLDSSRAVTEAALRC